MDDFPFFVLFKYCYFYRVLNSSNSTLYRPKVIIIIVRISLEYKYLKSILPRLVEKNIFYDYSPKFLSNIISG